MGLWSWVRNRLYQPVLVKSYERGLLLLNERFSRVLEPGLHRIWYRPDLKIDLRLFDTRKPLLVGLEPELEKHLPVRWTQAVDIEPNHLAVVYRRGLPVASLAPGHHLIWQLEEPAQVQIFDTESENFPEWTPELQKVLPSATILAGTVPEDHVALLFRDGVLSKVLEPGPYQFWQVRNQLRIQLQNIRANPFFQPSHQKVLGERALQVELSRSEVAIINQQGRPSHFLSQQGRYLIWQQDHPVQVEKFNSTQPAPELTRAQKQVIPASEFLELRLEANEVGVVSSSGKSRGLEVLPPGRSTWWTRGETLTCREIDWIRDPVVPRNLMSVLPSWTRAVRVERHELAVVLVGKRPVRVLNEGSFRIWDPATAEDSRAAGDPSMELTVVLLDSRETAPDPKWPWFSLLPAQSVVSTVVQQGQVGLLRRNGRFSSLLEPGYHYFWALEENVSIQVVEARPQQLQVSSQEMLTRDKVSLRLNLAVVYRIVDPAKVVEQLDSIADFLYLKLQLAGRRFVSSRDLDSLLGERDVLEHSLQEHLEEQVRDAGLHIEEVGLKDIILPGRMRQILNQVVEAQRKAEANNITRREETAATRSLANTARVLEKNPVLLRLKELEHVREIAEQVGRVNLIMSSNELGSLVSFPGLKRSLGLSTGLEEPSASDGTTVED